MFELEVRNNPVANSPPGKTKHLGNSSSTVQMYTGDDGVQYGKVSTLNK